MTSVDVRIASRACDQVEALVVTRTRMTWIVRRRVHATGVAEVAGFRFAKCGRSRGRAVSTAASVIFWSFLLQRFLPRASCHGAGFTPSSRFSKRLLGAPRLVFRSVTSRIVVSKIGLPSNSILVHNTLAKNFGSVLPSVLPFKGMRAVAQGNFPSSSALFCDDNEPSG